MKLNSNVFIFIIFSLFISSCQIEHNKPLLIGQWQLSEWRIKTTGEAITGQSMSFEFNADDTYRVDYGSEEEVGTWRVSGNNLFTTETGMAEKMVKIEGTVGDTLRFEMNRSGRLEQVVLIKVE